MTNREKLIDLLQEKDGKVNYPALRSLLLTSPLDFYCETTRCKDAQDNCSICAARWLNEEVKG